MKKQLFAAGIFAISILALFVSCQSVTPEDTQVAAPPSIPQDNRVFSGVLDNGLKYYVMSNPKPAAKAELRLVVNAGSVLEDEDQRGLAHFLEHMAFNGTELYPKNELVSFLQEIGMEFGADVNAYTSFDETVYMLSVPTDKENLLDKGLEVLEQWAFHMTIDQADVENERGVVHEEYKLGRGSRQRILDKILPILFKDSRYAERLPIGLEDVILSADSQRLRRFYEDWYRPDQMAVIAVGDFNSDEIVAKIKDRFSGYQNPDPERPRERFGVPYQHDPMFSFESDPEDSVTSVEILNRYDPIDVQNPDDYKKLLVESLLYSMINSRLSEILQGENPPFIDAGAYQSEFTRWTAQSGITALVRPDGIEKGLTALETEYQRIARYGFLQSELDRARTDFSSGFESYYKDRDNRESKVFLSPLQDAFLKDAAIPGIDWEWDQVRRLLPEITLEDFRSLIENRIMDNDRMILISGPDEIQNYPMTQEQAEGIVASVQSSDIRPWSDTQKEGALVGNPPAPGTVVSEDYDENAGIYHWVLSNGATVYLKPTDFKNDEILFSAFSPGGMSQVSDADYLSGSLASTVVQISGLGDFSAVELNKALTGINASIRPYISQYEEGLSGSATPGDLETLLKLDYLYFTSLRSDPAAWSAYSGRLADYLKNQELAPRYQYQELINKVLFKDHPRSRNITSEDIASVDMQKSLEIFSQRFSDASDFSFVFTGAFDPEKIRPLIEEWIGGLPSSGKAETALDDGMRYFTGTRRDELHAGIDTTSIVTLIWDGDIQWNYDNLYDMAALSAALNIILVEKVREEAGGTYSIYSNFAIDNVPNQDYRFIIQFSTEPERVDELIGIIKNILVDISANGIDPAYVEKVAQAQKVNYRENLERNSWWDSQIKFLVQKGLDWHYATDKTDWYNALTPGDIQQAVKNWIDGANYAEVILFPKDYQ